MTSSFEWLENVKGELLSEADLVFPFHNSSAIKLWETMSYRPKVLLTVAGAQTLEVEMVNQYSTLEEFQQFDQVVKLHDWLCISR